MKFKTQAVLSLISLAMSACTTYQVTSRNPLLTPQAELAAQEPGEELCHNISTMAFTIMTSRQLLGIDKNTVVKDTQKDYPGFESTIQYMATEAFRQDQVNSMAKANEEATKFKNNWTADLGVCESVPE